MDFQIKATFKKDATIILLDESQVKQGAVSCSDDLKKEIKLMTNRRFFEGKEGQLFQIVHQGTLVLLVGVGEKKELSLTALRSTVRKAILSSYLKNCKDIEIIPQEDNDDVVSAVIEGVEIGTYAWKKYKSKDPKDTSVDKRNIFLCVKEKPVYSVALKSCEGVNLARDLVNDNADVVTSIYVEKIVRGIIKNKKNITVEILGRKEMEEKKLGFHLAVNQGSKHEPRLIIVKYNGSSKKEDYTAFIGKGMTYDTGGLNLKPTGGIETMRIDMGGAAAVAGALQNAVNMNLKKNALFVLVLAENAIGKDAYKPGDVITGYSGKTVEVLNTDAEGRLVLADAISYVIKNYAPARIIDIATLTGACVVALGHDYTGLVSNKEKLAQELIKISAETDDRVWQLPSYPELKKNVRSKIADLSNIGHPRGAGGAITAAEFLHQFVGDTDWAHLDIAGTAFVDGDERFYYGHGATGVGVRLFTRYLQG